MVFKNKKHADRFLSVLEDNDFCLIDNELTASIYLLTRYKRIWKKFEDYLDEKNGIDPTAFDQFEPHNDVENALVMAAYDLLFCAGNINLADLTDKESIPNEAFFAICNALVSARFGFDSISDTAIKQLE